MTDTSATGASAADADAGGACSAEAPEELEVSGRLERRDALTTAQRDAMHGLFSSYFEGADREVFDRDLDEKQWVILLERADGVLCGFTTLLFYRTEFQGEPVTVVYSGDTIVAQSCWRTNTLHRTWIESVMRLGRENGGERLYWQLIVSGFRTYRLLPVFFREFFPRHDRATPEGLQALMDDLSARRFGEQYHAESGVVRFDEGAHRLSAEIGEITPSRLQNPHVRFFAEANPGHDRGDELVCIAEIAPGNLTRAGVRMTRRR